MNINWLDVLSSIQDLRSALAVWGITYEVLIAIGVAALILFFISLREIVVWYLKINQMQNQMRLMSAQLNEIKKSVDKVKIGPDLEPATPAPKKFSLDH